MRRMLNKELHTSSSGAEGTIAVTAFGTLSYDLTIDIFGVIGVNVARATTAVRHFGGSHCE